MGAVSNQPRPPLLGVVTRALHNAFVVPISRGRVRLTGLPKAVRAVVVAGYVTYGFLVLSVLLSGEITELFPARDAMGLLALGSVAVGLGVWATMVLLFLATLTLPIWWRLPIWVVIALTHAIIYFFALMALLEGPGPLMVLVSLAAAVAGLVLLLVVVATTWRRSPTGKSVVLTVVGLGLTGLVPYVLAGPASPTVATAFSVISLLFTMIALPLAVAAGTAFAQITVNLATASMVAVRERLPTRIWPFVAVVAGLVVAVLAVQRALVIGPVAVALTAAQTFAALGLTALALWALRGRTRADDVPPRPFALTEVLADVSLALGLALGSWGLPQLIAGFVPVPDVFKRDLSTWADLLMAVVALILLVRAIRQGRTLLVVLMPPLLIMGVLAGARTLGGWPSVSNAVASGLLALVMVGAGVVWRRRMTPLRWFLISLAMVVLAVFPYRQSVAEPLEAVLGSTQILVLLIGLVWLLLTEAEFTHTGSRRHGRPARVLVFLGYAVFSATMMVSLAYSDPSSQNELNMSELSNIGDAIIGYAFAPSVVVGLILLGNRGLDVIPPQVTTAGRTTAPGASTARR